MKNKLKQLIYKNKAIAVNQSTPFSDADGAILYIVAIWVFDPFS